MVRSDSTLKKRTGFITTPPDIAEYLVTWAIKSPFDTVLDIGVGEGIFLLASSQRLANLGLSRNEIPYHLTGVEDNSDLYKKTEQLLLDRLGQVPAFFLEANLFDVELPIVDAIVGNPPYVRRMRLGQIQSVQNKLMQQNLFLSNLNGLTDLYVYFLIYSVHFLKNHGRIAIIMSSAWLDVDYGIVLKQLLLSNFNINGIVMLEGSVFNDALVRPVLLFAEKGLSSPDNKVRFIRASSPISTIPAADELLNYHDGINTNGITASTIKQGELDPIKPWGLYLKTPDCYSYLVDKHPLTKLKQIAISRIGLQTLAGNFYIFDRVKLQKQVIPESYVRPLELSPRYFENPVIKSEDVRHYVLFIQSEKKDLKDENVGQYIEKAENKLVKIRGKDKTVVGYHNLPRLQSARRVPWYNLVTEINRRGQYPILLPRRFYEGFLVLLNEANFVVNENFIEIKPLDKRMTKMMLAFFNSSFFELIARSHAHLYGGGVYNLNPADVPNLPFLDIRVLSSEEGIKLEEAYVKFLDAPKEKRRVIIDEAVAICLDLSETDVKRLFEATLELRQISRRSKSSENH